MGKVGAAPTQVVAAQFKFVIDEMCKNLGKVGAAPTRVVAAPLEMFTPTHSRELAQVTSRDVPSRELAPNTDTLPHLRKSGTLALVIPHLLIKLHIEVK